MNEQALGEKAYQWLITYGPKIFLALIVFLVGMWLIRIAKKWLHRSLSRRKVKSAFRPFLASLIATVLQILLIMAILIVQTLFGFTHLLLYIIVLGIGVAGFIYLRRANKHDHPSFLWSMLVFLLVQPKRIKPQNRKIHVKGKNQ